MSDLRPLPPLSLAFATMEQIIGNFVPLMKLFWLPWLVSAIVTIIAHAFWFNYVATAVRDAEHFLPALVDGILWAPFGAMITVSMLRFFLFKEVPSWRGRLHWSYAHWVVTAIDVILLLAAEGITRGRDHLVALATSWLTHQPGFSYDQLVVPLWYEILFRFPMGAFNILFALVLIGLSAIVVETGRLDWRKNLRLLRIAPLRLVVFGLIVGAAVAGVQTLNTMVNLAILDGLPEFIRLDGWRAIIMPDIVYYGIGLPQAFFYVTIQIVAIAVVYRHLTGNSKR